MFQLTEKMLFENGENVITHIIKYEYIRPHCHEFIEFFYVYSGSSDQFLNGKVKKISVGDAFVLAPDDVHCFQNPGKNFMHRDIVIKKSFFKEVADFFFPSLFSDFLAHKLVSEFQVSPNRINQFERFCSWMEQAQDLEERKGFEKSIASLIIDLLVDRSEQAQGSRPVWVSQLFTVLSTPENFKTPLSSILLDFDYSAEYIMRTFKKYSGFTLTAYFNSQKLFKAYRLLCDTSQPIQQIAEDVGIPDVVYFYHLYKRCFGVTPKNTRENPQTIEKIKASQSAN